MEVELVVAVFLMITVIKMERLGKKWIVSKYQYMS